MFVKGMLQNPIIHNNDTIVRQTDPTFRYKSNMNKDIEKEIDHKKETNKIKWRNTRSLRNSMDLGS